MSQFPKVGNLAPDFSLLNQAGERVSLKDFRNKSWVVVYFYPKALTPGCTLQACDLRDNKRKLDQINVEVLGISLDAPDKLLNFIEKEDLNFTLLSDSDHEVAEKYGVWQKKKLYGKEFMGIARTTFVIDDGGKLIKIIENVRPKNHFNNLFDFLQEELG